MSGVAITPGRPTRATRPPSPVLPRLTEAQLVYAPGGPIFQQLTADTLGNAATDSDGHDAEFQDVLTLLAGESDGVSAMGQDLGAASFTPGDLETQVLSPIQDALAAAVGEGDGAMGDFTSTLGGGVAVNPLPETNPPPPIDVPGLGGSDPTPTGPINIPVTTPVDIPTTTGPTTTPPNIPPEGPGGTLDASTGQTGTLPVDDSGDAGEPVEEPTDLPLTPINVPPPDVLPPDDSSGDDGILSTGPHYPGYGDDWLETYW